MSKVYKLCTVDLKYGETIEYCLAVLKELDCKMIFSRALLPVQAILSLIRTVNMAKKLTKDDYQNLKSMSDPKDKATMLLAQRLTIACYLNPSPKNGFLLITCLTRMVQVTLKNGVGSLAGPTFATLGLLTVAALGDFGTAAYFCEVALLLQKRGSSKYTEAITLFNSHASCLAWTMPISSCLPPISEAYNAGMQSGNTEQAMWALQVYNVWMPYQMGRSLGIILEECPNISIQTEEVMQHEQSIFLSIFWQMMLNLTGQSEETTKLKGQIFNCDEFVCVTDIQDALFHLAKLELMVFFGDFEAAAKLALARGDKYEKAAPGYFLGMMETFHRGVALYAMARRTKKRKYKTAAKGILKTIATWAKSGNPNVKHYHSLLMAEQAALDMKYKAAESLYKDAVVLSARTGHLHHAGLINERYSDFLLQELGDEEEASFRRGEAIRYYKEWGADAMVERMTNPLS
jgi:predicted ATPase